MSDEPQLHVPVNIYTETEGPVSKQQIQGYIGLGRKMLLRMSTGRADGVDFLGQSVTLPDGTEIKVGYYDNQVAPAAWMRINAKVKPVVQEDVRQEDSSDYLWIGMRELEAPDLCDTGRPQETRLMLWVWEPPVDTETPSEVLSRWPLERVFDDPLLPEPIQPFSEHINLWKTPSGMYFISRPLGADADPAGLIPSPFKTDEDGDDLWHEVCVVDPKDGATYNEKAVKQIYGKNDPNALVEFGVLTATPTYYVPGDPDMPEGGIAPEEHLEKIEATVLPNDPEVTQKTYMIKVFYRSLYCDSLGPARGKLKIISGKAPHMVINRYEFQINQPNWKDRAVMPLGTARESGETACDGETKVSPGENRMDYGWSSETWEAGTIGGSKITQALPYGLNEGGLMELPCWCQPDPFDFEVEVHHLDGMVSTPGYLIDPWTYCAKQYQHVGRLVAGEIDMEQFPYILHAHSAVDECGRPLYTVDEVRAALSGITAPVVRYDGLNTEFEMVPGQNTEIYDTEMMFWVYYFWYFLSAKEIACGENQVHGVMSFYIEKISLAPVIINDQFAPQGILFPALYGWLRFRYDGITNTVSPR